MATGWSCFWRKDSKTSQNELTGSELFVSLANAQKGPSCPHPGSADAFYYGYLESPFVFRTLPTPRFPGLIPTFAPQKQPEKQLANNINGKQRPFFFHVPSNTHLLRSEASEGEKKRCRCCIFNRAARFNPTLTFKAQGLIPSLVKAFV